MSEIIQLKLEEINPAMLKVGEELRDDGVYCTNCGDKIKLSRYINDDLNFIMHSCCTCQKKKKEEKELEKRRMLIEELKAKSGMNQSQLLYSFDEYIFKGDVLSHYLLKALENYDQLAKEKIGILLTGKVGSGKTYLACSFLNALIEERQLKCKFLSMGDLVAKLSSWDNLESYTNSLLTNTKVLLIDDFGIQRDTQYISERLYDFINRLYMSNIMIIITTNVSLKNMKETDKVSNERIYSRIIERCIPMVVANRNIRNDIHERKKERFKEIIGINQD